MLQSLLLNWRNHESVGELYWINPDFQANNQKIIPLLYGLTVPARKVWLHDPAIEKGTCISCGKTNSPLFVSCEYQAAGFLKNENWVDPHCIYKVDTKKKNESPTIVALKAPDLRKSGSFKIDRPWIDLSTHLLELHEKNWNHANISYWLVGFATDKALNVDVWERYFRIVSLDTLAKMHLKQWQKEGNRINDWKIRPKSIGTSVISNIRPNIEHNVSNQLETLLASGEDGWNKTVSEYTSMMPAIAKSISPGNTITAVRKRHAISKIKPDIEMQDDSNQIPKI